MKAVKQVQGNAFPLNRADVDTDQIIPKQFLKRIERTGYGEFAFFDWRKDEDFVINRPDYLGAPIMLAQQNFGCGSSREHAVWALDDMGVQAVIAPSFGDIFRNNSSKVGLLTIQLPQDDVDYLMSRAEELPSSQITIDLDTQTVSVGADWVRKFEVDPFIKHRLLNGLDDIGITLQDEPAITAFEAKRDALKPDTTPALESATKMG
ncbi:MAG: 3-isopropylmalate dehydratase small subunit [Chloroflexi bacterium]|nr:3-isopropylmalate dehydratase small subunit [Chloroflexota bacterium]MDA1145544.1 3-isopropylmalate dehydratase small subunit [Chloroflexota bacterium]